jgi:Uncharacterized conserved protein (DUF2249)
MLSRFEQLMASFASGNDVRAQLRQIIATGVAQSGLVLLDLRELEAPLPLERALERAAQLAHGEAFVAWTPRVPQLLFLRLTERGLAHLYETAPDGTALVYVERR